MASSRAAEGVKTMSSWRWIALAFALASVVSAQSPSGSRAQVMLSSGSLVSVAGTAQGEIVREIDDPHTGDRWLLVRNDQAPGGPGRLVLVAAHRIVSAETFVRAANRASEAVAVPVIRSGDRLIVEEHTAVVDAVLEARAMKPAATGAIFEVRLTIGGKVVRAVALAPGRAALLPETEGRP